MKEIIQTEKAPKAIGAYSQAVRVGDLLYTSGQIPIDPATSELVENDVVIQAKKVMDNLQGILEEVGLTFADVFKTTIFISDMNNFGAINEVYGSYFEEDFPARSCVEVARLPKDVLLEVEVIATFK